MNREEAQILKNMVETKEWKVFEKVLKKAQHRIDGVAKSGKWDRDTRFFGVDLLHEKSKTIDEMLQLPKELLKNINEESSDDMINKELENLIDDLEMY